MAFNIGESASLTKEIRSEDLEMFAKVSLDTNPIHLDEEYARNTPFGRRIAHGMISAGLISATLANKLPGQGTVYLAQEIKFSKPVFLGDSITAQVEIIEVVRADKGIYKLKTDVVNQQGEIVASGIATVMKRQEKMIWNQK